MVQQLTGFPALEQAIQDYPTTDDIDNTFSNIILNEAVANETELIEPKGLALRTAKKIKLFPHLSILKMELADTECTTLASSITHISTNLNKIREYKPTANNNTPPNQLLQSIKTGVDVFNTRVREYQVLILADEEAMEECLTRQVEKINSAQKIFDGTNSNLINLKLTPLHELLKKQLFWTFWKIVFNYTIIIGLILSGIYFIIQISSDTTVVAWGNYYLHITLISLDKPVVDWGNYYLQHIHYIPFMVLYYGILRFVTRNIRAAQHQRTILQDRSTFIKLILIITKNQDNIDKPTCDRILDISTSNIKPIENTGYGSTPDKGLEITDIINLFKTIKGG